MYGNMSPVARGFNAVVAITWKTVIACVLGPAALYLDIASGANYFGKAFEPYVEGSFGITIPFTGWSFDWSYAGIMAFMLSAVTTGIQIAIWNFTKVNLKGKKLSPQAIFAIATGLVVFVLDVASDLGGATIWLSDTTDGRLWPADANMFQMITIPLIVLAGVANEALLEFFYGIDKPAQAFNGPAWHQRWQERRQPSGSLTFGGELGYGLVGQGCEKREPSDSSLANNFSIPSTSSVNTSHKSFMQLL